MGMSVYDIKDMEAEMIADDECEYGCETCGEVSTEDEFLLNDGTCFNCCSKLSS